MTNSQMDIMSEVAVIILNRNLPEHVDAIVEHLIKHDRCENIFVVEAGSDEDKISKHATWVNREPFVKRHGLRFFRGMNYGLWKLFEENQFEKFDYFFLVANDALFSKAPTIDPLKKIMDELGKVGLLSPCGSNWAERNLIGPNATKLFWSIKPNAYLVRREFLLEVGNFNASSGFMRCFFDGDNFRGYGSEQEVIAKGYLNGWGSGISSIVQVDENEGLLSQLYSQIKTESPEQNMELYIKEGLQWMKSKYGFSSHWDFNNHAYRCYREFFEFNPELDFLKV